MIFSPEVRNIILIRISGGRINPPSFTKAAQQVCRPFLQPELHRVSHTWKQAGRIQNKPVVLCSFGDASITEGEVSEAFQVAVLKKLPIIYLVQDNEWGISVTSEEARNMDAFYYAGGFAGMERIKIDGSDFEQSYNCMQQVFQWVRKYRRPYLVQARVPLLTHHTSGVRMEAYRSEADLAKHRAADPIQGDKTSAAKTWHHTGTYFRN